MASIIGGFETGLLDSSLFLLNRNDRTREGTLGGGKQSFINVANGNLAIQERDVFMPSLGEDFSLIRTYNSRGVPSDAHQHEDARWDFSTFVRLTERHDNAGRHFEVRYGDGSTFTYRLNATTGLYESVDGAGAFETIRDLGVNTPNVPAYVLTRADQVQLTFDKQGHLLSSVDTNGVRMDFTYAADRLVQVRDDTGHVVEYEYQNGVLHRLLDETGVVLVEYRYTSGRLSEVIDREGHRTQYFYTNDGFLNRIALPFQQDADRDGVLETFAERELLIEYQDVNWRGDQQGKAKVVSRLTDAEGGITTFDYNFDFTTPGAAKIGKGHLKRVDTTTTTYYAINAGALATTQTVTSTVTVPPYYSVQAGDTWASIATLLYGSPDVTTQLQTALGDPALIEGARLTDFPTTFGVTTTETVTIPPYYIVQTGDTWASIATLLYGSADVADELQAALGSLVLTAGERLSNLPLSLTDTVVSTADYTLNIALLDTTDTATTAETFGLNAAGLLTTDIQTNTVQGTLDPSALTPAPLPPPHHETIANLSAAKNAQLLFSFEIPEGAGNLHFTIYGGKGDADLYVRYGAPPTPTTYDYRPYIKSNDEGVTVNAPQAGTWYVMLDGFRAFSGVTLDVGYQYGPPDLILQSGVPRSGLDGAQNTQQVFTFEVPTGAASMDISIGGGTGDADLYVRYGAPPTWETYDFRPFLNGNDESVSVLTPQAGTWHVMLDGFAPFTGVTLNAAYTLTNGNAPPQLDAGANQFVAAGAAVNLSAAASDANGSIATLSWTQIMGPAVALTGAAGTNASFVAPAVTQPTFLRFAVIATDDQGATSRDTVDVWVSNDVGYIIQSGDTWDSIATVLYGAPEVAAELQSALGNPALTVGARLINLPQSLTTTITTTVTVPPYYLVQAADTWDSIATQLYGTAAVAAQLQTALGDPALIAGAHLTDLPASLDLITTTTVTVPPYYTIQTGDTWASIATLLYGTPDVADELQTALGSPLLTAGARLTNLPVTLTDTISLATEHALNTAAVSTTDTVTTTTDYGLNSTLLSTTDTVTETITVPPYYLVQAGDTWETIASAVYGSVNVASELQAALGSPTLSAGVELTGFPLMLSHDEVSPALSSTGKFFLGGTTRMVDALGNNRAQSNAAEYQAWRLANGFYALYDPTNVDPAYLAQVEAIRQAHSLTFSYAADGLIREVIDQRGLRTLYEYDNKENFITIIDANADAITRSDDLYFRNLRKDFGVINVLTGEGKLVAELTADDIAALTERFTTHLEYDERGNLIKRIDAEDNVTTFTHTSFNKLASQTVAMGQALITRDEAFYVAKRAELGFIDPVTGQGKLVAQLTAAEQIALLALFTTTFTYDANQNLIETKDPGGDLTRFDYDLSGNLIRRTVFLDANDLLSPDKQQVTQFFYNAFGNNIRTIDGEGNTTHATFDHFGNRLSFTDGRSGVAVFTYDNDDRLLTVTDPEGHVTVNSYDAVGNRIAIQDASGHTVIFVFDKNNMLLAVQDNSTLDPTQNRTTQFQFDVVGNRTAITDAEGRTTTHVFREDNRLIEVISAQVPDANGILTQFKTTFDYDAVGNRITINDNNGNITQHVFNPSNLLTQQTDALGNVTQLSYDANLNQVQIVIGAHLAEAQRRVLRFAYDEEDQLIAEVDALGETTRHAYDAPGNRIAVTDANGRTTDFAYDKNNRLITETRPEVIDPRTGLPTRYTVLHQYDANGNEIATTNENGNTTRFTFDKNDRVVLIEDANGTKTVSTFDSRHNRTSVQIGVQAHVDLAGKIIVDSTEDARVTTFAYDEFNQLVAKTDGVGNALTTSDSTLYQNLRKDLGFVDPVTGKGKTVAQLTDADKQTLRESFTERFTYDKVGNRKTVTDNLGRTTSFTYDALNRLEQRTDALNQNTAFRYDGNGNRVSQTDALGRVTRSAYDALDRLTDTTDPLGVTAARAYDSFGNLTAETRAAGSLEARTTQFVYDLNNRLIQQTDPEGHAQSFEYDAVGNRLKVTDARGNATDFVYDALNRNIKIIDPLLFETKIEFDGVGNRITLVDARGGIERLTYDPGNRYIQTQDAEGRITRFAYDVRGNRITQTTAFGTPQAEVTTFEYDAEDNLRSMTDAEGNVTAHDYDRVYNRIATTDGNGHTTQITFDAVNRLLTVTDAEGGTTTFTYDAVGNRLTQTDALARVTTFTYDANDRLVTQTAADGVKTEFAYDAVGNRARITRAAGTLQAATTTFAYNRDDQLISETDPLGQVTTFTYDANHNRTVVTDPLGHATVHTYDANNRVTRITDPLGNAVAFRYDGNGNRVQVVDARGFTSTTYFNADNEVVLSVDNEGFATSFVYDANGNVISQTLHAQALALPLDPNIQPVPVSNLADQTSLFSYDRINRLIQRIDGEGFVIQFDYDAASNRIETRQALDLAATQFAIRRSYYDDVNRKIFALSAEGFLTENRYDAVGNRIARIQYNQQVIAPADGSQPAPVVGDPGRTTSFVYDPVNRLIRETSALGVQTEHEYDARGNRTATTEAAGTADARRTDYRYDAADRYIETVNALGVATRLELDADGNILTRREAAGTLVERVYQFAYDGNHRVISETDALGVVTLTNYDASGNIVSRTMAAGLAEVRTETFEFDRNNRQVAAVNAADERTEFTYDAAGNQISITQAPGLPEARSNVFVYDRDNRLAQAIDAVGTVTEYRYDGAGNKIETTQAKGTLDERQTVYVYDRDNRLVQITDPESGVTNYEYDVLGSQTRIIDANGGVQQNTFDAIGRAISSLSAGRILTQNAYDLRNNLVNTIQSFADGTDARTTSYAYDLLNRQTRITDGEGFSTSIVYDAFGNQISVSRGQYLVTATDPAFDPGKASRGFAQINTFVYDVADRLLSLTDAEGNITTYTYDAVGNRLTFTEAANTAPRTTAFAYDLVNRLIETRTPEGGIARNTYDQVGNRVAEDLLQSGDELTGVFIHRQFEYDGNARLTAEIDPFGTRTEHDYDAMGNRIATRAAAGTPDERVTRMEYDFNNRKTADIDGEGNRTSYAFDSLGNRTKLTDALGREVRFYFDRTNQLIAVLDSEGYVNAFEYDAAGNRTSERAFLTVFTGPISDTVPPVPPASPLDRIATHQFDRANQEIVAVASDGARHALTYDGAGNLIREVQFANTPSPRTLEYVYDLNNRLARFTDVEGSVTTFTYDGANNKTSESIANAADSNAVRATFFEYDLNNRKVREIFDPTGLNIIQTWTYDRLANVVTKTDGNGNTTSFSYDLNNRITTETTALGNTTRFDYDRVGNQIRLIDARGFVTDIAYDRNNRVVQESRPQVEVFTIDGGVRLVRPTVTMAYNAVGDEVQIVDANGFITTRYFDGNGQVVAELSGDNVLREFTYNTVGEQESETLYMTRLTAAAHNPLVRPTPPAGAVRTTTLEYDLAGRITRVVHPAAEITTLSGTDTNNPTVSKITRQVDERHVYDAFGNEVESFDRNGNRSVSFYDAKDRQVAVVDALGFLVEWDYDAQDNQIAQRVYAQPLDPALVTPQARPTPPPGEVFVTSRRFDAASRLVEEQSPTIEVFDPVSLLTSLVRPTTTFTYDQIGNQRTKTIAATTPQAITEFSFFDADNRLVAVINNARVLHTYQFDASANLTLQKRFFNPIPLTVDLATLTGATDFAALVSADAANDQATRFTFDALNRVTAETDLLGPGVSDDLTKLNRFNARGERTSVQDEDGFVNQTAYDAAGRTRETIGPDGSGTSFEYDAAGNQILAFTGNLANRAQPATNLSAVLGDNLTLTWQVAGGAGTQSWVVFDTFSHERPEDYANRTATQVGFSGTLQASLPAITGQTLFVRVVTQDIAGNITFTAEQSLTVPPRFTEVAVVQPNATTLEVSARFDAGAVNPRLNFGIAPDLNSVAPFVLQTDGSFKATITGVVDAQALSFQLVWEDAVGRVYTSAAQPFEARADQVGITSDVAQGTVVSGTTTLFTISVNTKVPTATAARFTTLEAQWRLAGSGAGFFATAVAGTDSGLGFVSFPLILGDTTPLDAGTYEIFLRGVTPGGNTVLLDTFEFTVGDTATPSVQQSVSWIAPLVGDDQVVIVDGARVNSVRQDQRVLIDTALVDTTPVDYQVFYSQRFAEPHTLDVTSTPVTVTIPDPVDPTVPPQVVVTGFDLGVQVALSANEVANIPGDLRLAWRPAGTGTEFPNDGVLPSTGINTNTFATTLPNLAAGQYDLKVYYIDALGREVIVEWQRVDTATAQSMFTDFSHTVLAREVGGTLTLDANGLVLADPGLYTGPLDANDLLAALTLDLALTGSLGGSQNANGLTTGYFTEIQYNALDVKIASNENDGLWREFGVDANGNAVETRLFGDQGAPSFIDTFTAFDARNREIAQFGERVAVSGQVGLQRPVRRLAYNVLDNVLSDTDALGNTRSYEFNALGTQVKDTDALGASEITRIDVLGNTVATVSKLGNLSLNFYDAQARLIRERDGVGNETAFAYDSFDRRIAETNGLGTITPLEPNDHTTRHFFDQRDRLTRMEAAQGWHLANDNAAVFQDERERLGFAREVNLLSLADRNALIAQYTVNYAYDGRDNRTSTLFPLGQRTDEVYDSVGRVIDTVVFLDGVPTHNQRAYDAYGNLIAETDGEDRATNHVFGGFSRILEDIDPDGIRVDYDYDRFRRIIREFDPDGPKDIQKTYDDAGRLLSVTDLSTGVSTTYAYDLLGRRLSEVITTPGNAHNRNIDYSYDALGQLVRWDDSVTGLHLNTFFDAEGNRVRAFTDTGYDPDGNNTDANPNFRFIDHVYSFDGARRVTQKVQRSVDALGNVGETLISAYGYDQADNRITWNNQGVVVTYAYDAINRVVQGDFFTGSTPNRQAWTYDAMGNVLSFRTFEDGTQTASTVNRYNDANRVVFSDKDGDTTTTSYDNSLLITQTVLRQGGNTFTFVHDYFGDGREKSVRAFGNAAGNSTSTYDANKVRTRIDLGQGDAQDRPEFKTFVADNEGHIIFEFHDDGESATRDEIEYAYANGNPVGETGPRTDGETKTELDTGRYALVANLGEDFPEGNLTYTARDGDTLQGIAATMYGNPSLWFVIADANGLDPNKEIKAGTQLTIPNTVKTGHLTNDTHKVYSETEIVGSTLPNLKSPPPPKKSGGCGNIIAIIIVVVIAIVVSVITAGVAAPIAAALTAGVTSTLAVAAITVATFAVVGAVVAAVGSIIQQGLFIALGFQEKFSWKDVGTAALSGLLTGAAQGVGAVAKAAAVAGELSVRGAQFAKVAGAALKAGSVAVKQIRNDGKITSWTSLAGAAIGGFLETGKAIESGAEIAANLAKTEEALQTATKVFEVGKQGSEILSTISDYVTPWVQLAETFVRNDGELTPLDWANAVGSTLSSAVSNQFGVTGDAAQTIAGRLQNGALRLSTNLLVAGALRHYDKEAAQSFFENAVGQEAGQFIGGVLAQSIQQRFFTPDPDPSEAPPQRVYDHTQGAFVDRVTGEVVHLPSVNDRVFQQNAEGELVDQHGNPAPAAGADTGTVIDAPGQDQIGAQPYEVQKNDTLSGIAGGNPALLAAIVAANQDQLTDINLLIPGQTLVIPSLVGVSETDLAELTAAGNKFLEVSAAIIQAQEAERANAAALEQLQTDLTAPEVPVTAAGINLIPAAGADIQPAPSTTSTQTNAAVKALISIIEPFAAANKQLEELRAEHPWLARAALIGVRTLAGGPVAAVIKTIGGEAIGNAVGPIINKHIIEPIVQFAQAEGINVEQTLYLLGGVSLIASVAFGVRIGINKLGIARRLRNNAEVPSGVPRLATPTARTPGNIISGELDSLGRPTGVSAVIRKEMLGTGSGPNSSIRPPGFQSGAQNHARGHLLANILGGSGNDARNLVTLFQRNANHPNMSSFENAVRRAVDSGEVVSFRSVPIYTGSNLVPTGVTLAARGSNGFTFDVSIPNVGR